MVIFRRPEGKPGYHQADSVDDATRFVEMLRNQEQVTDARIFRMEEVPFEFRTVFKVEIVPQDGAREPLPPMPEVDGVVPDELPTPAEAAASARARSGRFQRAR
jgi:hypothetical protein